MKRLGIVLLAIFAIGLSSCSKDDDQPAFDYPLETLYGTWEGTGIFLDNEWIDVTSYWYKDLAFSISFYENGAYYGSGFFGNGSGTYKAYGKTIETFVDGEYYLTYTIVSLTDANAEVVMSEKGSTETIRLRVRKK